MESKFAPAPGTHVYCINNNNTVKESQNGVNCCHCGLKFAVWALAFFVMLLAASNIYLHFELNNIKSAGTETLVHTNTVSESPHSGTVKTDQIEKTNIIDVRKRSLSQIERNRRRRHRRVQRSRGLRNRLNDLEDEMELKFEALRSAILKQVVHLRGSVQVSDQETRNPVYGVVGCRNSGCFRWSNPDSTYATNFQYVRDPAMNKVVGIKISSPGVYLIYSQVGVNGPRQRTDPSIGYETVKTDSSGNTIVLMRSFITQDERGRSVAMFKPHDSINQFGVFKLNCDDIIIVRQDTPASNNPPDFVFDGEQSFFGIVQINPTNGALDGNYDCNAP